MFYKILVYSLLTSIQSLGLYSYSSNKQLLTVDTNAAFLVPAGQSCKYMRFRLAGIFHENNFIKWAQVI